MNPTKQEKIKHSFLRLLTPSSTNVIQSARAKHDLRAACLPRAKPRRVAFFYALLRGLAYPAARSRMLSELAPVMTTTLSLILGMRFCFETRSFPPLSRCSPSQLYLLCRSSRSLHSTSYFPHSHFFSCVSCRNYRARSPASKYLVTNSAVCRAIHRIFSPGINANHRLTPFRFATTIAGAHLANRLSRRLGFSIARAES
jgi:hypothetical protein